MKSLTIATAILALMAMPAYAQMGGRHHGDDGKKAEPVKKVDEKAYKAALERIPDPKEKYDPWAVAKPADAAKDSAKKPKTP
jgi:ABC-type cobalt transport system substrate-binding protein